MPNPIQTIGRENVVSAILWSDPSRNWLEYRKSERNCGHEFNEDALDKWLDLFNCETLIRAHQFCQGGFARPFGNDKCITIFSSADYCGRHNSASALIVQDHLVEDILIVEPIDRETALERKVILPTWIATDDMQVSWLDTPSFDAPDPGSWV
jgi:protein phosphatase